ncbi:hypothetical protein FH972_025676 [Carpinus fangiana]|uniref:FAD-binding PCMH-type domain-containing protein n=1 Tax=Carpinus fangiana TaxID=176857 RepID=A0A5N6L1Z4_9ROSI|nr:hypothetical protein FH972_025676 [Carpinus fangiana]
MPFGVSSFTSMDAVAETDPMDSYQPLHPTHTSHAPLFPLSDLPSPSNPTLADPAIPFRSQSGRQHATWARTFHSRPELYITPYSIEEVQKAVTLARRCRRRLVVVGSGHSPSDLTCSSSWMLDLRRLNEVQQLKPANQDSCGRVLVQAGISLGDLNRAISPRGYIMPNLGSIDVQSIAGAIATGTHGSSLSHGILVQSVRALRMVLADGQAVWCSASKRPDLFRAALVSLGALGVITEIEFHVVPNTDIEWSQHLEPLEATLANWNTGLWTQAEFVRCWWMPYSQRTIIWKAEKTTKPRRIPKSSFYGGQLGFQSYRLLLWVATYVPRILPWVEWFVFGMQYRFSPGHVTSAVEPQADGLLMDCLFSQFVNEWALPLSKGPEAIRRLSKWINGDERNSRIPYSSKGIYVHCPIEVRVSDGSKSSGPPRAFLDPTMEHEPTLYLNATLYRPFGQDPPCVARYYEAFEWLMKDLGGRPHWAKNFSSGVKKSELHSMYGTNLQSWLAVRKEVDPEGMFVGAWHRRNIVPDEETTMWLEEKESERQPHKKEGGWTWVGAQAAKSLPPSSGSSSPPQGLLGIPQRQGSEESFDFLDNSTDSGEEVPMTEALLKEYL